MRTHLQFSHSLQPSFLRVEAHWMVVVITWHFLMLSAWKSLLLACHHEQRQPYFLDKEQTTWWYIEAQHAVYSLSWFADGVLCPFPPVAHDRIPQGAVHGNAEASSASLRWEQAHLLRSVDIQADEACQWRHMSQVHAVTLIALRRTISFGPPRGSPW